MINLNCLLFMLIRVNARAALSGLRAEGRCAFRKEIDMARQHLLGAGNLPGLLSAGQDAFEVVIAVAAANADSSAAIYPAFTFARGFSWDARRPGSRLGGTRPGLPCGTYRRYCCGDA